MFIEKSDLKFKLYEELIAAITREDDEHVSSSIEAAVEIVRSHLLAAEYDAEGILSKAGKERNAMVRDIATDIARYKVMSVLESFPEVVSEAYERSVELLGKIAKGAIVVPNAPKSTDATGAENTYIKYGQTERIF